MVNVEDGTLLIEQTLVQRNTRTVLSILSYFNGVVFVFDIVFIVHIFLSEL